MYLCICDNPWADYSKTDIKYQSAALQHIKMRKEKRAYSSSKSFNNSPFSFGDVLDYVTPGASGFKILSYITLYVSTSSSSLPSIMATTPPLIFSTLKQRRRKKGKAGADSVNRPSVRLCVGRDKSNKARGHFPGRQVLVSEASERGVESQQMEWCKQQEADANSRTLCLSAD